MRFIYDLYMVISYAMIVGLGIALTRDSNETRHNAWVYIAALFWPIAAVWMVVQSYIDFKKWERDQE